MDNAAYEAYRINAKIAGVVYDAKSASISPAVARQRITELWGDVLLRGKWGMFPRSVVAEFEAKLTAAAKQLFT